VGTRGDNRSYLGVRAVLADGLSWYPRLQFQNRSLAVSSPSERSERWGRWLGEERVQPEGEPDPFEISDCLLPTDTGV